MLALSCTALLFTPAKARQQAGGTSSGQQALGDKILIAYFTWPEPDGVDAASGASRIVSDGQLYGNTEYVARILSEATGGDLFAIKTERTVRRAKLKTGKTTEKKSSAPAS